MNDKKPFPSLEARIPPASDFSDREEPSGVHAIPSSSHPRALRIVHVVGSFDVGGAERAALQLASRQAGEGHCVRVVGLRPGALLHEPGNRDVPRKVVRKNARLDPSLPPRLAAEFLRHRADIVHTHNPPALVWAALAAQSKESIL